MTIHAYDELYLDDAMDNLGDMFSYAIDICEYDPDEFFSWFISCGLAEYFGQGNPKFVAGMSGIELAIEVIYRTTGQRIDVTANLSADKSPAYWAGWSLAYYQWYSGRTFRSIYMNGLTMSKIMSMYLLHEADVSKFVEVAEEIVSRSIDQSPSRLQTIRKARGLTQKQLSDVSGVKLRMIQLYEQKKNDINHASVSTVRNLASVLGCRITDLLD